MIVSGLRIKKGKYYLTENKSIVFVSHIINSAWGIYGNILLNTEPEIDDIDVSQLWTDQKYPYQLSSDQDLRGFAITDEEVNMDDYPELLL